MAILQKMVINAGAYPACGLSGMNVTGAGTLFTASRQAGAGPSGGDSVRWTQLPNGGAHAQYTFGWTVNQFEPGGTDPALGSTRYHRWYIKLIGNQDYNGNNGPWYTKYTLQGNDNPGVNEGRVITHLGVGHVNNTDTHVETTKNVSGIGVISLPLTPNVWHAIQVEVKAATTLLGTNGSLKMWVDNDVLGSPLDTETGINITTNGWGGQSTAVCGGFAQTTIAPAGLAVHEIGGYEYADAFDASWFANMGSSVVVPPVEPPTGPGTLPLGTPFLMKKDLVYKLPAKKCTIFTDASTPVMQQSNTAAFTNNAPVTFVTASSDLGGGFVKCTSGDVTVTVKAN